MKAISIKQPWASLIAQGIKDIENRTWKCPPKYIGQRVLIHASRKPDKEPYQLFNDTQIKVLDDKIMDVCGFYEITGAIIGSVKIVGCVINHSSIWADQTLNYVKGTSSDIHKFVTGQKIVYNWILAEPILFQVPIPVKGKLSFWDVQVKETKIECPKCGYVQMAFVDHTTVPFSSYVHECCECGYIITESEWNEIKE